MNPHRPNSRNDTLFFYLLRKTGFNERCLQRYAKCNLDPRSVRTPVSEGRPPDKPRQLPAKITKNNPETAQKDSIIAARSFWNDLESARVELLLEDEICAWLLAPGRQAGRGAATVRHSWRAFIHSFIHSTSSHAYIHPSLSTTALNIWTSVAHIKVVCLIPCLVFNWTPIFEWCIHWVRTDIK